jgi:hypothetical protein
MGEKRRDAPSDKRKRRDMRRCSLVGVFSNWAGRMPHGDFGSRDAGSAALWRTAVSVDRGGAKILARSGMTLSCLSSLGYLC